MLFRSRTRRAKSRSTASTSRSSAAAISSSRCRSTFELSCDRRYCVFAPCRTICSAPCAGQKRNAVGRQLERVVRRHRKPGRWTVGFEGAPSLLEAPRVRDSGVCRQETWGGRERAATQGFKCQGIQDSVSAGRTAWIDDCDSGDFSVCIDLEAEGRCSPPHRYLLLQRNRVVGCICSKR